MKLLNSIIKQQAISTSKNVWLLIEPDQNVGIYLMVYDLKSGVCIKDFLYFPDQLESLYNKAFNLYGIDKDQFYPISE